MSELNWYVGVDWASRNHQVCVLDGDGAVRGERVFAHGGPGLWAMASWILETVGGAAPAAVGVAIETPRGPVVESLLAHGLAVHSINPKQLDRFRDRYSPAGAKDDRRDARVLASALRTDPHCLRRVATLAAELVELREWTRMRAELIGERTRLTNRMHEMLWRHYPAFNQLVGDDLAAAWAQALWQRVPTPAAAHRTRLSTYEKLLRRHRIRRVDAATLKARLTERPPYIERATATAAEAHARLLAQRLAMVAGQLAAVDARIDALLGELGGADPGSAAPAATAGEPRDATILRSITGIGRSVLSTLLAEAGDVLSRRDYRALRNLCGTAPVTRQSGRTRTVTRRLAVHGRLRDAVLHWARVAVQHDAACAAQYRALRARGHGHYRALRSVADGLLRIARTPQHRIVPKATRGRQRPEPVRQPNRKKDLQKVKQSYNCKRTPAKRRRPVFCSALNHSRLPVPTTWYSVTFSSVRVDCLEATRGRW